MAVWLYRNTKAEYQISPQKNIQGLDVVEKVSSFTSAAAAVGCEARADDVEERVSLERQWRMRTKDNLII